MNHELSPNVDKLITIYCEFIQQVTFDALEWLFQQKSEQNLVKFNYDLPQPMLGS